MNGKLVGVSAGILSALILVGAGAAIRNGTLLPAGSMCGLGNQTGAVEAGRQAPRSKSPDLVMSVMCERACAAKLEYRDDQIVGQPGATSGDLTRCPVSGVVFLVKQDNPGLEVKGDRWLTCCETCVAKLRRDPERFLTL